MPRQYLFTHSTPVEGREAAFQWATGRISEDPNAVLYIAPPDTDYDDLRAAWQEYSNPLSLSLTRFDGLVNRLYQAAMYEGSSKYVSRTERHRIVEEALDRLANEDNPLYTESPSVGLVEQAEELLTLLEFSGIDSPAVLRKRLAEAGVSEVIPSLEEFFRHVQEIRASRLGSDRTFRSERYQYVIEHAIDLFQTVLSETDCVIVGAFQTLSPLERDLLGALAGQIDTAVVLCRLTETAEPSGVDQALSRITNWYEELGFREAQSNSSPVARSSREAIAASLYRYDDRTQATTHALPETIKQQVYPTILHEARGIAREIRSLIADGVDPEQICIAPYDTETYTQRLAAALRAAEIPVRYERSVPFFSTTVGKLFESVLNLGTEPDRQQPLCRLLTNPLVNPSKFDGSAVTELANRLESNSVDTLRSHVDSEQREVIDEIVEICITFVEAENLVEGRDELLSGLGVPVINDGKELTDELDFSPSVVARETSAFEHMNEVCVSLTEIGERIDPESVRRGLEQGSAKERVGRRSNSVRLCSPSEAVSGSYTYVFVPGLTAEHTPSPTRRLAFTRQLNDAHPDFAPSDPVRRTRYTFGLLLASDATLILSAPEQNTDGDPYIPADVLVELRAVTDSKPERYADHEMQPATHEDVHRSLAAALETGGTSVEEVTANVEAYDLEVPHTHAPTRIQAGVTLADARSSDTFTEFDGHLPADLATDLRPLTKPFSPSALEQYASCSFKFYMDRLLGIEAEDQIPIELDSLDAGTFVHDVLEAFYRDWADTGNGAVTEATVQEAQESLYRIALSQLEALDVNETSFHEAWLRSLFDGLDVPENEYGDRDGPDGLFKRFIDAEAALSATVAQPTYFEAHVGLGDEEDCVIRDEPVALPGSDVLLHGKIDRVDLTPEDGIVAYDYKTGGTPSESDSLDGYRFQLPVYLLLAEAALGGEAIGASYYKVNPSSRISYWDGTIGAGDDAEYYRSSGPKPLRRVRTLEFESRNEFHEFLRHELPDRLEKIGDAVTSGTYHPSVLGPDLAKCSYCDYRNACDVRHHRRHALTETVTDERIPAYLPVGEEVDR